MRPWPLLALLALLGCTDERTCAVGPVVTDGTGTIGQDITAAIDSEIRRFDLHTASATCARVTIARTGLPVARSAGFYRITLDDDEVRHPAEATIRVRRDLCEAVVTERVTPPSSVHRADEPVWESLPDVHRELLDRIDLDGSSSLTEAEAAWTLACMAGRRDEAPLRRLIWEQCGAPVWSEGLEDVSRTWWRPNHEAEFEPAVLTVGAPTVLVGPRSNQRLLALSPHLVATWHDGVRFQVDVDGQTVPLDDSLFAFATVRQIWGLVGQDLVISEGTGEGSQPARLWAWDLQTSSARLLLDLQAWPRASYPLLGGLLLGDLQRTMEVRDGEARFRSLPDHDGAWPILHAPPGWRANASDLYYLGFAPVEAQDPWVDAWTPKGHHSFVASWPLALATDGALWSVRTGPGFLMVTRTEHGALTRVGVSCDLPGPMRDIALWPDESGVRVHWADEAGSLLSATVRLR
jgi:hypothetical protein